MATVKKSKKSLKAADKKGAANTPLAASPKPKKQRSQFFLGMSWGITTLSLIAFGGILIYVLTSNLGQDDDGTVLSSNIQVEDANDSDTTEEEEADGEETPEETEAPPVDYSALTPVSEDDFTQGPEDAVVTLVVFNDFACEFCSEFADTLNEIVKEYPDDVKMVFRHFPLTNVNVNSFNASIAAECAAEQGKFWEMYQIMFDNNDSLGVDELLDYAGELGDIDDEQFAECLESDTYREKISDQQQEAVAAGVTGAPATFVNERLARGSIPYEQFAAVIDGLVEQLSSSDEDEDVDSEEDVDEE